MSACRVFHTRMRLDVPSAELSNTLGDNAFNRVGIAHIHLAGDDSPTALLHQLDGFVEFSTAALE